MISEDEDVKLLDFGPRQERADFGPIRVGGGHWGRGLMERFVPNDGRILVITPSYNVAVAGRREGR